MIRRHTILTDGKQLGKPVMAFIFLVLQYGDGVDMLMKHYLDDDFKPEYLGWVVAVHSEEYYVKMMAAWFFATALAKQYDAALPVLTGGLLDRWTHNKTIQKAIESDRVDAAQKAHLHTQKKKK